MKASRAPWLALSIALAAALLCAVRLYLAQRELRTGMSLVQQAVAAARDVDGQLSLASAAQQAGTLQEACRQLSRGSAMAQPFAAIARPLALAPPVRGWGRLDDALQAGDALCAVSADVQALASPLAGDGRPTELGPALLARLDGSQPRLTRLAADSGTAVARLATLEPADFNGPLAPLGRTIGRLQVILQPLALMHDYASRAPELAGSLLGASAPKTYLILGQDNAEPRATGGFVGVMGPIELSAGRVTHTDFRSSYDWDDDPRLTPLAPPQALQRYMNSGAWFLRDANWWPDFRQSAGQVETLWTHRQGGPVDGVIAVDLQALDDLLVAVDGVDVPELGGHVTAGTAEDEIEKRRATRQALASYADYQRTKTELLSALYRALLARLLAPAPEQLPGIAAVVAHDLQTKHLMLEFDDPQLAAVAAGQAWDGRLSAQDESSLAIFDTELSYGKLGPYISKEARYEVGPGGRANLSITYGNSFRPTPGAAWDPFISGLHWDWQKRQFLQEQGAWLGYIRVVVPGGTRLEAGSGWDDQVATTDDVPGSTTFAAPLLLEPGQSRTVSLQYQLPAALSPDSLTAIAQPGARPFSLNARLPAYTQSIVLDGRDVRLEPPR